jgi:hypothetical protein
VLRSVLVDRFVAVEVGQDSGGHVDAAGDFARAISQGVERILDRVD